MKEPHDYDDLFREASPQLWRTLYAYSGGRRVIADDAVAEAFARAIIHDRHIREPIRWIYRVAFRLAAEDLRKETAYGDPAEDAIISSPLEGDDTVMQALHHLSPSQRAAIYLHYEVDLPVREVAWRMRTSVGAVKVHLHHGRKRLRALLSEES